ncbi:MAG: DUF4834 family protein [Prevotella sp.]|nr:DUF4834 family protein [Prevotella sp.]
MKLLIGIPVFLLAIAAAVVLVVLLLALRMALRLRKYMRGDYSDEEVERLSKKYRNDADHNPFASDYFKRREQNYAPGAQYEQAEPAHQRTTQTAEGFTIIDDRQPDRSSRRIFTEDEGEYVEFTEEK